jgi:hypothetical protein
MDMQIWIHNLEYVTEQDKVIFIRIYLRGAAFNWFKPYIWDYQDNSRDEWKDKTNKVFNSYKGFKKAIIKAFRDPDAEKKSWITDVCTVTRTKDEH